MKIEDWAEKARMCYQNPEAVKYLMSLSKEEIQKEKNKMEGIEKLEDGTEEMQIVNNKKRSQEEITQESEDERIKEIAGQLQDLNLIAERSSFGQRRWQVKKEERMHQQVISKEASEKKSKTDKEAPRDDIIKDVQKDLDRITHELNNFGKREEEEEYARFDKRCAPLESSLWAPQNRNCDKSESYKAKMPTYKIPGSSKEERVKFVE